MVSCDVASSSLTLFGTHDDHRMGSGDCVSLTDPNYEVCRTCFSQTIRGRFSLSEETLSPRAPQQGSMFAMPERYVVTILSAPHTGDNRHRSWQHRLPGANDHFRVQNLTARCELEKFRSASQRCRLYILGKVQVENSWNFNVFWGGLA